MEYSWDMLKRCLNMCGWTHILYRTLAIGNLGCQRKLPRWQFHRGKAAEQLLRVFGSYKTEQLHASVDLVDDSESVSPDRNSRGLLELAGVPAATTDERK